MSFKLFRPEDEHKFKMRFIVQFLASHDAVNYASNCSSGWKHHRPAIEDAMTLADEAWESIVSEYALEDE